MTFISLANSSIPFLWQYLQPRSSSPQDAHSKMDGTNFDDARPHFGADHKQIGKYQRSVGPPASEGTATERIHTQARTNCWSRMSLKVRFPTQAHRPTLTPIEKNDHEAVIYLLYGKNKIKDWCCAFSTVMCFKNQHKSVSQNFNVLASYFIPEPIPSQTNGTLCPVLIHLLSRPSIIWSRDF